MFQTNQSFILSPAISPWKKNKRRPFAAEVDTFQQCATGILKRVLENIDVGIIMICI